MNRRHKLLLCASILIFSFFLRSEVTTISRSNFNEFRVLQIEDISAIMTVNDSYIVEGDTVEIYLILKNPTLWKLYNISYTITIPHKKSIEVIWAENTTDKRSFYEETDDDVLLKSNISFIDRNSTIVFTYKVTFLEKGTYEISCSDITFTKVLGEIEESSSISGPKVILTVNKIQAKWIPAEGTIPSSHIILAGTVVLPLLLMFSANKIQKSKHV